MRQKKESIVRSGKRKYIYISHALRSSVDRTSAVTQRVAEIETIVEKSCSPPAYPMAGEKERQETLRHN